MVKVNALIIGAGRSGTTTLADYMAAHPGICFSRYKEVHYFSFEDLFERGEEYFHGFFKQCSGEKVFATADTYIMCAYDALYRIKKYNPEMKFIAILRNPVERAYSNYIYSLNNGYEKHGFSFLESFKAEKQRLQELDDIVQINNLCHFYTSRYALHLEKWREIFPREQFFITTIDDLNNNKQATLKKLAEFLGLDEEFQLNSSGHANKAAVARSKKMQQLLLNRKHPLRRAFRSIIPSGMRKAILHSGIVNALQKINKREEKYPPLDKHSYDKLTPFFEEDLEMLRDIWGIDLE